MAQDQVNGILEGLKIAQARRATNLQNTIAQQRLQQDQQNAQNEYDIKKKELDQRANEFDVTTKAAQAMHKLQLLQEEQRLSGNLENGMSIPGATSQPGADADHLTYQVPGIDAPLTVRTPEAVNRARVAQKTAEEQPAHDFRIQELGIESQNQKDLAQQNRDAMLEQMKQQQKFENDRAATHEKAENFRTSATNATHIEAAKIAQGLDGLTPDQLTPYVHQIVNGDLTDTQLGKLPLQKGVKAAIMNGVTSAGGTVLNDKEQDTVKTFTPIKEIVQKLDQYNAILKTNPSMSRIPGTDAYKQTKLLSDEIEGILPNVARVIATDTGRLSNQQIQMVKGMTEPSKNFITNDVATNEKRRNDFLSLTNDIVDSKLSRLPEGQRAAVKQKMGLTDVGKAGTQVPQQQQQPGPRILKFDAQGNQIQ